MGKEHSLDKTYKNGFGTYRIVGIFHEPSVIYQDIKTGLRTHCAIGSNQDKEFKEETK